MAAGAGTTGAGTDGTAAGAGITGTAAGAGTTGTAAGAGITGTDAETMPMPAAGGVIITEVISTPWEPVTAPEAIRAAGTAPTADAPISAGVLPVPPVHAVTVTPVREATATPVVATVQMRQPGTGLSDPAGAPEVHPDITVVTAGPIPEATTTVGIIPIGEILLQGPPTAIMEVLPVQAATGLIAVLAAGHPAVAPSGVPEAGHPAQDPIEAQVAVAEVLVV